MSDIKAMIAPVIGWITVNSAWIIAGMAVMILVLLILVIHEMRRIHWLTDRYDLFMRGKDCETMEDTIVEIYRKLQIMQNRDLANKDIIKMMNRNMAGMIAKTGLVRYNAFKGMGGQSSFAMAMLNLENHGYILNAVHNRNSCYVYVKNIIAGEAEEVLSEEEQLALDKAMGVQSKKEEKNPEPAVEKKERIEAADDAEEEVFELPESEEEL